jgi:hypothetical protein
VSPPVTRGFQIPQLVDIVRVGNQNTKGDALAAAAACVVRAELFISL